MDASFSWNVLSVARGAKGRRKRGAIFICNGGLAKREDAAIYAETRGRFDAAVMQK